MNEDEREAFIPEASLKAIEAGERMKNVPCYVAVVAVDGERLLLIGLPGEYWAALISALRASERPIAQGLAEGILHAIVKMGEDNDSA